MTNQSIASPEVVKEDRAVALEEFRSLVANLTEYDIDDDANASQNGEDAMSALNRLIDEARKIGPIVRGEHK